MLELRICVDDDEVLLVVLVAAAEVGWLLVEQVLHPLELALVEHSLEQLLSVVGVHDGLGQIQEAQLGQASHLRTGVLQVISQLTQQLVVLFEEQNAVPKHFD